MGRIRWSVRLALFMDAALFLAVIPLLPDYSRRFDLSTLGAGVIVAAYPVLVLVASIPAGALASRVGGRRLTIGGSACFTLATILFVLAPNAVVLACARAMQGVGSGITWSAGLAWLIGNEPADRRGSAAGAAMAMVSVGAVAGPGIGALAGASSPTLAFSLAAVVGLVATVLAVLGPEGARVAADGGIVSTSRQMLRSPLVVGAMAIGTVDSVCNAVINLLAPLELGRRGIEAWEIGAALIVGALLGAACGPFAGRLVDRTESLATGIVAALGMTFITALFALPLGTVPMLALLVGMSPLFTFLATAMYPPAAEGADRLGLGLGAAYGLISISWGIGYSVGPLAGALLAHVGGDATGYLSAAAVSLGLVATAAAARRQARLALSS